MNILYLHQYFNTPDMSGGTRSYEMARRFVQQGHEVHMITSWREPRNDQVWFESNEAGILFIGFQSSTQIRCHSRIVSRLF